MLVKKLDNYRAKSSDEETVLLVIPRKFTIKYSKTMSYKTSAREDLMTNSMGKHPDRTSSL